MKTPQEGSGRKEKAKDVKAISPETWARLSPLARALIVKIADLLAEDAPTEKIMSAIRGERDQKTYFFQVGYSSVFLKRDRALTPEDSLVAAQEIEAIRQALGGDLKMPEVGPLCEIIKITPED